MSGFVTGLPRDREHLPAVRRSVVPIARSRFLLMALQPQDNLISVFKDPWEQMENCWRSDGKSMLIHQGYQTRMLSNICQENLWARLMYPRQTGT